MSPNPAPLLPRNAGLLAIMRAVGVGTAPEPAERGDGARAILRIARSGRGLSGWLRKAGSFAERPRSRLCDPDEPTVGPLKNP
jgi:hypothetical protein